MVLLLCFTTLQTNGIKHVDILALYYLITVIIFQDKKFPSTKSSASRLTALLAWLPGNSD